MKNEIEYIGTFNKIHEAFKDVSSLIDKQEDIKRMIRHINEGRSIQKIIIGVDELTLGSAPCLRVCKDELIKTEDAIVDRCSAMTEQVIILKNQTKGD
jgi:hypothetical protein